MIFMMIMSRVALPGDPTCNQPGPDVIVGDLPAAISHGRVGDIAAFSIATTACNLGDTVLAWEGGTPAHPVIGQNLFRLVDGRFEHIGQSWIKHGFAALQEDTCGCGCIPAAGGTALGVGCSDPYTAGFNGAQQPWFDGNGGLGPKFEVNATTGVFPYPYTGHGLTGDAIYKRLQVHVDDIDPALNFGASYFAEGQYVSADDASAGHAANNASYRPASITTARTAWTMTLYDDTQRGEPAIQAWAVADPEVHLVQLHIPGDGVVWIGSRVTAAGNDTWHYEYAIHNLNATRAIAGFAVPLLSPTTITNPSFHDVEYHSGEPVDGTDWLEQVSVDAVTWATTDYVTDPLANALRWGTLYNYRFDADVPPGVGAVDLSLFEPGSPAAVTALTWVPGGPAPMCGNGALEPAETCDPPDGNNCSAACTWICGDRITQEGETCDDGNTMALDGCSPVCQLESEDHCHEPMVIGAGPTPFSTTGATSGGDTIAEGLCDIIDQNVHEDIWLRHTASCDGTLMVSTCPDLGGNADFDTRVVIYEGCASEPQCPAGVASACNDDDATCGTTGPSTLIVPASAGQCFAIRLGAASNDVRGSGIVMVQCTEDTVACCLPAGCAPLSGSACLAAGGSPEAPGSSCAISNCPDGPACPNDTVSECCDLNTDQVRDDGCQWCACESSACTVIPIAFADMGGPFGACPADGFVNIHDRNHALNCFSGVSTCAPLNIDAGGAFGSCLPDGFCNIHDANHALAAFAGSTTCMCPSGPAPHAPLFDGHASVAIRLRRHTAQMIIADVFAENVTAPLQGYQLDIGISGGASGGLDIESIEIERRKDWVFANKSIFEASNAATGQLLCGLDLPTNATIGDGYLATIRLKPTPKAHGAFVIDLQSGAEAQSYLLSSPISGMTFDTVPSIVVLSTRR
jgi:cysteine-rich repeat protein